MRRWIASAAAALLCAGTARAQDRRDQGPAPAPPRQEQPPLSKEDAELVKELALLEQLDLVRNLDLFQEDKEDAKEPQRQP